LDRRDNDKRLMPYQRFIAGARSTAERMPDAWALKPCLSGLQRVASAGAPEDAIPRRPKQTPINANKRE
jgi:hypothetical protein